jgi:hypothetical protein
MRTRSYRRIGLIAMVLAGACSQRPGPLSVADNMVVLQNQTSRDWRNVVITVNDHFRGGAPSMAAGSRLAAPLSQFQTAFGQRYDIARQTVFKIEVTATDSSGELVRLEFDAKKRGLAESLRQ